MGEFWDLIGDRGGEPVLARSGVPVRDLLVSLESETDPNLPFAVSSLRAAELMAVLGCAGLGPAASEGPPLIHSSPERTKLGIYLHESVWAEFLPDSSRTGRLALVAGLAQILDFWEFSHEAAQEADDLGERSSSAYWHGIAHRREPDAGNASYWFRRVGRHPVFTPLAVEARPLLEADASAGMAAQLFPQDKWDPYTFTNLCTTARAGSAAARVARRLQRLEMSLLLEHTVMALFS